MNRGWCSGTRPFADGITANGYPLDSAMPANAFFALATRIFGPPTITGFTALFRKSAAASTAYSKFALLLSLIGHIGTGSRLNVGWERPARLQPTLM
ncbi:Os05g0469701 [Oryza sativa Japonica Group]|uniref:Os05g0469701 protein n=1 Tax=Oryza sativa subsp. japonica TaxID=39947 RepID=A0A0P0WNM7_ORYSJ|nr:hypothetical protein EE612_030094 [Oryza sativa]BAS94477.1 Os05g0469701 [Oryza sativa Japonica Group]